MKRLAGLTLVGALVLTLGGVFGAATHAESFKVASDNGDATLAADKTVDGTAYLAGNNITVEGTVKGDLFCAGKTIVVKGTVEGDVICGGMTVTVGGTVLGDVRVAGSDVFVDGKVGGSVTAAGSSVVIKKDANIARDATLGASTTTIDGTVGRDVLGGSQTLQINGTVGRDVTAETESLQIMTGAQVAGNVTYTASEKGSIADGTVKGKVGFTERQAGSEGRGFNFMGTLFGILSLVVLAVLATLLMPRFVHTAASLSFRGVLLAFLAGLAFVVLVPVLAIVLMSTVVGAYAAAVLLVAYVLVLIAAFVFASYYTGTLVLQKRAKNAVLVAAVGALVLGILLNIPILQILVFIAALLCGVGMQILHVKYQFSKQPYKIVS